MADPPRPSPEALLRAAAREGKGRLKIFLGAAPGVGKTFEMLEEGAARLRAGIDVVIGVVETHGRADTAALVTPFEIVPARRFDYLGRALDEMDLDAVLARRPALVLVDEFAHTNVEGSRHPKRWQDVAELLDAGIHVYTTLNVQHIESLNDVVASFTRVRVRETVPDSVFEYSEIEVVDLPPDELIDRLKDGKVYVPEEATRALSHFFSKPNLSALREMALRFAAQNVDRAMLEELDANAVSGTFAGGERVLVAVSELPGADGLVRAAKRLADALRASWTAIYIETPRAAGFDDAQRRRIADTLALAATLGATIATVPAENVIAGLRGQVEAIRATQLVIGRSRRSWWFELRHGSVVEAMLEGSAGLAVHVIPASEDARFPSQPRRRGDWGGWASYATIALLIAAVTAIGYLIAPIIGVGAIDLLYLLPVIVTASRVGLRPGLAAGLAAALAYNFFFLPPIYTFTIADPQSVVTVFVLLGVAVFTSHLADNLRSRMSIGVRGAQENAALAAFAQELARVADRESTAEIICSEVGRLLDTDTVVLGEGDGGLTVIAAIPAISTLGAIDRAAADWTWTRGEAAGNGTATLNAADWQFHPLATSLGVLAVLGVARADSRSPVTPDRAVLLATLIGQAALAQERVRLEKDARELLILKEQDRLRTALLSSIGHDLRTPLTSVIGAIEALRTRLGENSDVLTAQIEAQRLKRFLDNLLDMIRIDADALNVAMEPIDLTDAIASAVHDLRVTLRDNAIDLKIPPNLPLVRADPRLLHHILINLLANASQHGGADTPIELSGREEAAGVTMTVRDFGAGLGSVGHDQIFGTFQRGLGSDRVGGSGLGLAIAEAFAHAMGATIHAKTGPETGAAFELTFSDTVEATERR
ncbi:MAG: sensor histidine kinase KdpD [Pseudomonadota bacterium]